MTLTGGQLLQREIIECSTADVPPQTRPAYWNDTVSVPFPGLAVDWPANELIHARLKSRPFADARVTEVVTTPGRATYTPPRSGSPGSYRLVLQIAGSERYTHAGREVIQDPNDLVLLDAAQSFEASFPRGIHILVWDLPRNTLAPLLASPERAAAVRISGNDGLGGVLAGYARSLAAEAVPCDAITRHSLELHLCSLAALALGASQEVGETRYISYRAACRQRILAYIEGHLREAGLTVERAARDLRMSGRWLHALLAEGKTSFAAWVARRRVEECRKLLENPACDPLPITEIALRCGFSDLSTFNRRFRAHYGMAPRDVRCARSAVGERGRSGAVT